MDRELEFPIYGEIIFVNREKCHIGDKTCNCSVCIEEIRESKTWENDLADLLLPCMTFISGE